MSSSHPSSPSARGYCNCPIKTSRARNSLRPVQAKLLWWDIQHSACLTLLICWSFMALLCADSSLDDLASIPFPQINTHSHTWGVPNLPGSKSQSILSLFFLHCMRCEPFVITYLMWLPFQRVCSSACAGRGHGLIQTRVAPVLLITQQRLSHCVPASPAITIGGIYVLKMEE